MKDHTHDIRIGARSTPESSTLPRRPCSTNQAPRQAKGRVSCYACTTSNFLDGTKHWCTSCNAPLTPTPAWVLSAGWPHNPIPARDRRRLHHRAKVPVKAVRFDGPDGRSLAGSIEILAKNQGVRINDLLQDLLRTGIQQHLDPSTPAGGEGL